MAKLRRRKKVSAEKKAKMDAALAKMKKAADEAEALNKRAAAINKAAGGQDPNKPKMGLKRKLTAKQVMKGSGGSYSKYKILAKQAGLKAGPEKQFKAVKRKLGMR